MSGCVTEPGCEYLSIIVCHHCGSSIRARNLKCVGYYGWYWIRTLAKFRTCISCGQPYCSEHEALKYSFSSSENTRPVLGIDAADGVSWRFPPTTSGNTKMNSSKSGVETSRESSRSVLEKARAIGRCISTTRPHNLPNLRPDSPLEKPRLGHRFRTPELSNMICCDRPSFPIYRYPRREYDAFRRCWACGYTTPCCQGDLRTLSTVLRCLGCLYPYDGSEIVVWLEIEYWFKVEEGSVPTFWRQPLMGKNVDVDEVERERRLGNRRIMESWVRCEDCET